MEIEFIYTYHKGEQEFARHTLSSNELISKESLMGFATRYLNLEERIDLKKISCCVSLDKETSCTLPAWYIKVNGKFWFQNGNAID